MYMYSLKKIYKDIIVVISDSEHQRRKVAARGNEQRQ